jgi:hypothetical protein
MIERLAANALRPRGPSGKIRPPPVAPTAGASTACKNCATDAIPAGVVLLCGEFTRSSK